MPEMELNPTVPPERRYRWLMAWGMAIYVSLKYPTPLSRKKRKSVPLWLKRYGP